ncbi:MAG: hypothetical protein RJB62_1741 [Pseudomonadota bacterium]
MKKSIILIGGLVLVGGGIWLYAQQIGGAGGESVAIDADDIGGVVTGANGPEAGVWVIAETHDLDVRYIKIVVTDDEGRYVLPDLPDANYEVWVRGYGLVDSPKIASTPGNNVNHEAVPAATEAEAAHYYPAIYWYSMMDIPTQDQFGGTSIIPAELTFERYMAQMKNIGCVGCHQLGQLSTRTIPPAISEFTGADAWIRRIQSGQAGEQMMLQMAGVLGGAPLEHLGKWTDEVAAGALPFATPPRPQGVERNVVITLRDWMDEKHYLHDAISTDKRYPTVNGYGPIVGSPELSSDNLPIMDPVHNTASIFHAPTVEGTPMAEGHPPLLPSPYWGDEALWDSRINNHNSMFGRDGRVWLSAQWKPFDNSDFCKEGSDHPSAQLFPLATAGRRLTVFNPKTLDYQYVDICFSNHHLQFGFDENETLWTSGGGPVLGWLNTKMYDETGDAAASQGWTAFILDTNGNGQRDAYVEPNAPVDPAMDKRINGGFYAIMPSPADGSIWGTVGVFGGTPGVVRVDPGANPPATAIAEVYNLPREGFGLRGGDIDKNGVVWVSASSGHLASFDRRLCTGPLNGPTATGDHCPEGWKFYQYPGPGFEGIGENSAESSYYTWVDQHNILGLGEDVPMSTANLNDGIAALVNGEMVMLRVPYPLGFYSKGFDGRIDDAEAGWKGRGLWIANGDRTPWLIEGGQGTKPLLAHIQLRPDPLAR